MLLMLLLICLSLRALGEGTRCCCAAAKNGQDVSSKEALRNPTDTGKQTIRNHARSRLGYKHKYRLAQQYSSARCCVEQTMAQGHRHDSLEEAGCTSATLTDSKNGCPLGTGWVRMCYTRAQRILGDILGAMGLTSCNDVDQAVRGTTGNKRNKRLLSTLVI